MSCVNSDMVSAGGSYFDSNDMASLLESHFEDLSTGPTANLPLTDQVCHLRRIPLWTDEEAQTQTKQHHLQLNVVSMQTLQIDERPVMTFCIVRQQFTPLGHLLINVLMFN